MEETVQGEKLGPLLEQLEQQLKQCGWNTDIPFGEVFICMVTMKSEINKRRNDYGKSLEEEN